MNQSRDTSGYLLANHSRTNAHFWLLLCGIRFRFMVRFRVLVRVRLKVLLTRLTLAKSTSVYLGFRPAGEISDELVALAVRPPGQPSELEPTRAVYAG